MTLVAERLAAGVGERQARRRLLAAGLVEPRRYRAPEVEQRIRQLFAEQLPADWIAEDVGEKPATVRAFGRRAGIPMDNGWKEVRLSIVKNPELRKLHEEIAP